MTAVEFVTRIIGAFEKLAIPYLTVGSFSVNVYGDPRSTKDADFVVQMDNTPITRLMAELGGDFELEAQMRFETITATSCQRIFHRDTAFMIELFLLSDEAHDRERFARRVRGNVGGVQAWVPTAEDVVITKLRWSRQGNRQKDVDDVQNVIDIQLPKLDLPYIRHWCDQHGTRSLFERLLLESQQFEQENPP